MCSVCSAPVLISHLITHYTLPICMRMQPATLTEAQLIERLNSEGKMITDGRNSNQQPRFTVNELREILIERNELKSRLIELEEELAVYKRAGWVVPQDVWLSFSLIGLFCLV